MFYKAAPITLALVAGTAAAQPFVHNAAEATQAWEYTSDLTLLTNGEIAAVGGIRLEQTDLVTNGHIMVYDPSGVPVLSWLIDDPDSFSDENLAAREDPTDKNLIVLQEGAFTAPPMNDLVLYKIDPFSGALMYAWRYAGFNDGENLGMELDGNTGLVAASVRSSTGGTDPMLLRFDNGSGAPIFHNRYPTFEGFFDGRFFDVEVHPETRDIYAVGSIKTDDLIGGPAGGTNILIARFSPSGAPIWFRSYDPVYEAEFIEQYEGTSIEFGSQDRITITARGRDATNGVTTLHMGVTSGAGLVTNAKVIVSAQGGSFEPAYSSLERVSDSMMLVSGNSTNDDGTTNPTMWAFDDLSGSMLWTWASSETLGNDGTSAIPQPGEGALLGGEVVPAPGPIGGFPDHYLARTDMGGNGLCPKLPELREIDPEIVIRNIPVDPAQINEPREAGLQVMQGDPVFREICENSDCPPDLNGDGVLDFFDLSTLLSGMIDYDGNTVFDFFDISAFLADFSAGC